MISTLEVPNVFHPQVRSQTFVEFYPDRTVKDYAPSSFDPETGVCIRNGARVRMSDYAEDGDSLVYIIRPAGVETAFFIFRIVTGKQNSGSI